MEKYVIVLLHTVLAMLFIAAVAGIITVLQRLYCWLFKKPRLPPFFAIHFFINMLSVPIAGIVICFEELSLIGPFGDFGREVIMTLRCGMNACMLYFFLVVIVTYWKGRKRSERDKCKQDNRWNRGV